MQLAALSRFRVALLNEFSRHVRVKSNREGGGGCRRRRGEDSKGDQPHARAVPGVQERSGGLEVSAAEEQLFFLLFD